jgi:ribosomal protein L16 Arg81 hydroxylase
VPQAPIASTGAVYRASPPLPALLHPWRSLPPWDKDDARVSNLVLRRQGSGGIGSGWW